MQRSKKVVFISHCILNQNTVVCPLARAKGAYKQVIDLIMENNIGIHQMPCPEFEYLGLKRNPMNKKEYDNYEYRIICKNIAIHLVEIMKEYISSDYKIIGIIGINESPTCSLKNEVGIFMEELNKLIYKNKIKLKTIDIPEDYNDNRNNDIFLEELNESLIQE